MRPILNYFWILFFIRCWLVETQDQCVRNAKPQIIPIDRAQQAFILDLFNTYRNNSAAGFPLPSFVATNKTPIAGNMIQLKWDAKLAKEAEGRLNLCDVNITCYACYKFRLSSGVFFQARAKIVFYGKTNDDFKKQIAIQYNRDIKNFRWDYRTSYGYSVSINDFTLLVKADTRYLGCATSVGLRNASQYTIVCFLAPSEQDQKNVLFVKAEKTCSLCPKDYACSSEYLHLCKAQKQNKWNKIDERQVAPGKWELVDPADEVLEVPEGTPDTYFPDSGGVFDPNNQWSFPTLPSANVNEGGNKTIGEVGGGDSQANKDASSGSNHNHNFLIISLKCLIIGLLFA